jgi:MFS family permease
VLKAVETTHAKLQESIFAVMQLFTIYFWARFSDHAGRRPVVIICGLGIAAGALGCSLVVSFPALLAFRSLSGLFAGHAAVLLSALGEMSDPSNRGQAFSIYSLAWPTGVMIGYVVYL